MLSGTSIGDAYGVGGVALSGVGQGAGRASESSIGVGDLARVDRAVGVEAGALFSYTLASPVDLRAHGSALLPYVQEKVEAEPITWFSTAGEPARAAVRMTNNTRQTLPAGTLAAFASGGLAGETALARLKPGGRRYLAYGNDPDVDAWLGDEKVREEPRLLTFRNGVLEVQAERTTEESLTLENRSGQPRTVCVGLAVAPGSRVEGAESLDENPELNQVVAVFHVEPRKEVVRPMKLSEHVFRTVSPNDLTVEALAKLAAAAGLPGSQRSVLNEAIARRREIDEAKKVIGKAEAEIATAEADVERLRKHLAALGDKQAAAATTPFVQRILSAEDRLDAQRKRLAEQNEQLEGRFANLRAALEKLGTGGTEPGRGHP